MLPAYIIDELRRARESEEADRERPRLELPAVILPPLPEGSLEGSNVVTIPL